MPTRQVDDAKLAKRIVTANDFKKLREIPAFQRLESQIQNEEKRALEELLTCEAKDMEAKRQLARAFKYVSAFIDKVVSNGERAGEMLEKRRKEGG